MLAQFGQQADFPWLPRREPFTRQRPGSRRVHGAKPCHPAGVVRGLFRRETPYRLAEHLGAVGAQFLDEVGAADADRAGDDDTQGGGVLRFGCLGDMSAQETTRFVQIPKCDWTLPVLATRRWECRCARSFLLKWESAAVRDMGDPEACLARGQRSVTSSQSHSASGEA